MVVTFAYADASTVITINSISLIPSNIPARPAPKSFDDVVRQCQYYYEKSYDLGVYAGAVSNNGLLALGMNPTLAAGTYGAVPLNFSIIYNTRKRIPVNPSIYSIGGTLGSVFVQVFHTNALANSGNAALTNWTQTTSGQTQALFQPVDLSVAILGAGSVQYAASADAAIYFHFIADARLGIV
jgi:hypothetical protein